MATTDSAGGVQSEVTYEPFGATEISSPTPAYRFTGREHDEPLYLYYYRARYYHTDLQRFISEDPIDFGGGNTNLYAYVGNSPVLFIDPLGLYVTVTRYKGQGINPAGHVGIAVNSPATVGFYGDDSLAMAIGDPVPGHVASDLGHEVVETIRLDTTLEQERIINEFINEFIVQRFANPGNYTLGGRSCAAFVTDALEAARLSTSGSVFPAGLMRDLKQRYGASSILRP